MMLQLQKMDLVKVAGIIGDDIYYTQHQFQMKDYFTSKTENKFATMTVNGKTYPDVYQMFYNPRMGLNRRIWWVPKIGFIKLELLVFDQLLVIFVFPLVPVLFAVNGFDVF